MCGILGVVSRNGALSSNAPEVRAILQTMGHRGPDAEDIVERPRFSFGHRRLAITDVGARSDQPMTDRQGVVFVTFNGEIYNFRQLRAELEREGYGFRTQGDTEVILVAYKAWGEAFVDRLNGMFAIGIYDESRQVFLLYRDRVGVKPVYYYADSRQLCFASELKGVIGWRAVPRRLNVHAVSSFLSYRHVLGPATYFEGVMSLEPGTYLRLEGDHLEIRRYWRLETDRTRRPAPGHQDVLQLIKESVHLQGVADVPVAALLSGGLDSSILVYEMTRNAHKGIKCFTGRLGGEAYDESTYAREVAISCGADWNPVELEAGDLEELVREQVRIKDQPLGMHNEVAMFKLAKAVSKSAKVLICGEGADELFGGYGRLARAEFDLARMRFGRQLPGPVRRRVGRISGWSDTDADMTEMEFFLSRYSYFPLRDKQPLWITEVAQQLTQDAYTNQFVRQVFEENRDISFSDRVWLFLVTHHLPGLLEMIDAATMGASVEARVPFTDHRLVQCAFDLPPDEKVRWRSPLSRLKALVVPIADFSERLDETKVVLRRLYQDRLPDAALRRRKMGFPIPLGRWMSEDGATADMRRLLFSPTSRLKDLLVPAALRSWFDAGMKTRDDQFGCQLWRMVNLEIFLQEYF